MATGTVAPGGVVTGGRPRRTARRVIGACILSLFAVAGLWFVGIAYGYSEVYGFDYESLLALGPIVGSVVAAGVVGGSALLGLGRRAVAIGLLALVVVVAGSLAAGWAGGRAKEQSARGAGGPDEPVAAAAIELSEAAGRILSENTIEVQPSGCGHGTCAVGVYVYGVQKDVVSATMADAAKANGWVAAGSRNRPSWERDGVTVRYEVTVKSEFPRQQMGMESPQVTVALEARRAR